MLEVVRIEEGHLSAVAELERLTFSEPWSESALKFLTKDSALGFAVIEDGELCAYGGMVVVLDEGQITNIATHPSKKRRGYATLILQRLAEYARANGITAITLEVRESNLAARALYEKQGFSVIGRRRGFYKKPTEDALLMELKV